MKKSILVEVISAVFILIFFYNALDAFINLQSVKNLLRILPFTYNKYVFIAWGIVVVQLLIAVLAFFHKTRVAGFIVAIGWSLCVIAYLLYTPRWPHEFAGVYNYLNFKQQLILSAGTGLLALYAIIRLTYKTKKGKPVPEAREVVFT